MSAHYSKLLVWQKAMDVTVLVYNLMSKMPKTEMYGLTNQMQRAVVSIPSNIAEGQERNSDKDFVRFSHMALGSKAEPETQLLICQRIGYLTQSDIEQIMIILREIGKMINGLIISKSEH